MPHDYPPFPPGPHHPEYPHNPRMWYTDVEPAYEQYAECDCHHPPAPQECVCVTESDANSWNGAYSAISAVSAGLDIQTIASAAELLASADYWNQTHDVVSANSATWNTLPELSANFTSSAEWLLWNIMQTSAVYHDDTLTGDGSKQLPLGIAYSEQYDQLLEYLESLTASAPDLKKLWDAMEECKDNVMKYIAALSGGHVQNYELILQLMGKKPTPGGGVSSLTWQLDEKMKSDDESTYVNDNMLDYMYYSTYKG